MGTASSEHKHLSDLQILAGNSGLAAFHSLSRVRSLNSSAHFESLFNIRFKRKNSANNWRQAPTST